MLGLNFSHREAIRLGLDADEALDAVFLFLKPECLRISLYWDEISPEPGTYDLTAVQTTLDRAERHDCRVLVTVGFKPQRHPNFTPPRWLIGASLERLTANMLMMLERAIALLADFSAIDAWETEYLPFLPPAKQPQGWSIRPALLERQLNVLHEVDPRHRPVVVSHPGGRLFQSGWREALVRGGILGCELSMDDLAGRGEDHDAVSVMAARLRVWQLSIQATLAAAFSRQLWVTELLADNAGAQAERPGGRLEGAVANAMKAGAQRIYIRGVEQWLCVRASGTNEPWDEARTLFRPP